jgi:hypothetical protein
MTYTPKSLVSLRRVDEYVGRTAHTASNVRSNIIQLCSIFAIGVLCTL